MNHPKISIITISYNSAKTIEETIQSVVQQDYDNKEYLIIDNASTDGTMDIVAKYRDQIAVTISEKDNGISNAFNKGIERATGEIIGIINSDDILMPGALSALAQQYEEAVDIYRGSEIFWNPETGFECREEPSMKFPKLPFFVHVSHQGTFVRKDAYERFGDYDEKMHYSMDLDFLMRAYAAGAKFKRVDFDMAKFRAGGTTSDDISKKKKEFMYLLTKNGCTTFQAKIYCAYLQVMNEGKKFLNLFGKDFKHRLRYKKTNTK